jgi:uncharacterized protein (DUF305 family)
MTVTLDAPSSPPPARASWARLVIVVLAAVGLLLFGAAAGLLLRLPGSTSLAVPPADSVDVGFAQDMSVHHQQAVQMAGLERDQATEPVLHQLAFDIETSQLQQIGRMQGWLSLWGASALPAGGHMAWMAEAPGHSHAATIPSGAVATMPGMASPEQLRALRQATGLQHDVLFLQLMLRHHEGGASMLDYAAEHATVPEVRNLAAQMLRTQTSESEYLRQLLTERGGTPLPL